MPEGRLRPGQYSKANPALDDADGCLGRYKKQTGKGEKVVRSHSDTHIRMVKLVSKFVGLKAEDQATKRYFVLSMGAQVLPPAMVRQDNGKFKPKFKSFKVIEQPAKAGTAR